MLQNTNQNNANCFSEAMEFADLCADELAQKSTTDWHERRQEVESSLQKSGIYSLSFEELEHGARVAWRNNARCIGRLFWSSLKVRDRRDLDKPELVAADLIKHIGHATNEGKIQPLLTVYAPADTEGPRLRIWNHQLFGYAGYGKQVDGSYLGDPKNETFTAKALELGWQPARTNFDLLPWIIQKRGEQPCLFDPPVADCLEVPLRHPKLEWFSQLGLRWYGVPILSDMNLRIGGMDFPAAPFNGWYMETEIGSRDLGDTGRYNVLPELAERMGLLSPKKDRLWKDRALVELNEAVLHSFSTDGVRIVDHHRASSEFMRFVSMEQQQGRLVSGNWSWLVPPMSGSATEVFHHNWKDRKYVPDYLSQAPAWDGF